jgi:hypothetical protein
VAEDFVFYVRCGGCGCDCSPDALEICCECATEESAVNFGDGASAYENREEGIDRDNEITEATAQCYSLPCRNA